MHQLPEEYEFINVAYNPHFNTLEIRVEHSDIPSAKSGTKQIEEKHIYQAKQICIVRLKEVPMIDYKETTETIE